MLEYSIGRVRETQGNDQSARDAYGRALVENLAFYPGHTALARLALAIGRLGHARRNTIWRRTRAQRADIRYVYGVLLLTRNVSRGCGAVSAGGRRGPVFREALFPVWPTCAKGQGKDSLAIAYYTQFIALAPAAYARQVEDARQRLSEVKRLFSESH